MPSKNKNKKVTIVVSKKKKIRPRPRRAQINQAANNPSSVTPMGRMLLQAGNVVGGMFGLPTIFGMGDYSMTQNSLWEPTTQVPFVHSSNTTVRLRHREFIQDIFITGSAFSSVAFPVNPGVVSTFPYLNQIALEFQEYRFLGLIFEFKTTSATSLTSGTNTAMGSVMLSMQYRADAPLPGNKQQMLDNMWSVDTVPSKDAILPVECDPIKNDIQRWYVRALGTIAAGDLKLYDLGTLIVATAGGQTAQNNVVGELWVSYDIELVKPTILPTGAGGFSANGGSVTGVASATPFGTTQNTFINFDSFLGGFQAAGLGNTQITPAGGVTFASSTVLNMPIGSYGYYYVQFVWTGTAGANFALPVPTLVGAVYADTTSQIQSNAGVVETIATLWTVIFVLSPGVQATITVSAAGTLPGGTTVFSYFITQVGNLGNIIPFNTPLFTGPAPLSWSQSLVKQGV